MGNKPKLRPRKSFDYDESFIRCRKCRKSTVVYFGSNKYVICEYCGAKTKDKIYKETCVAYRNQRKMEVVELNKSI